MKIKFLGAVGEVTGSCTWCILDNGTQFLVDCGMFQGGGSDYQNRKPFPFNPREISFVLLTHAHIDHCGRIPMLYKQGFEGEVICTQATKYLTMINLRDSAEQQQNVDIKYRLYEESDVKAILFSDKINEHHHGFNPKSTSLPVGQDIWVNFMRSSHMLGAASIAVTWGKGENAKNILFSGDVGNNREGCSYQPLLRRNQVGHENVDYVVLESTYGEKAPKSGQYKNTANRIEQIKEIVQSPEHGLIIFPCFAMQRTQDVLMDLVCTLAYCGADDSLNYRIILDSKMGMSACHTFCRQLTEEKINGADGENVYLTRKYAENIEAHYGENFSPRDVIGQIFDAPRSPKAARKGKIIQITDNLSVEYVARFDAHSNETDGAQKTILITSSGMCQEGKIRFHLMALQREHTALVLTGYQSTSNGKLLQQYAEDKDAAMQSGEKLETCQTGFLSVKNIKGAVYNMGAYYSGHADSDSLLRFLFEPAGKDRESESPRKVTVFLNHGDNAARQKLKDAIEKRDPQETDMRALGGVVIPPANGGFYDLNKNEWVKEPHEIIIENQKEILQKLDKLLSKIKQ